MYEPTELILLRLDRMLRERLEPAVYREQAALTLSCWDAPGEPVTFDEAAASTYRPISIGDQWGAPWGTTWFRVRGEVPASWKVDGVNLPPHTIAEMYVDLGFTSGQPGFQCEAMIWDLAGNPVRGIAPLNNTAREAINDDGTLDLYIEAASNPDVGSLFTFEPTPVGDKATAGTEPIYQLRAVEIRLRDLEVSNLIADAKVLRGLVDVLPADSPRRADIVYSFEAMMNDIDPHDVASTATRAREILARELEKPATTSAHTLHAVGHAHIDSAWLWPVRETVRKVARTFSNVLSLMDEHPEFTFAASSAQQYAWMKQFYPSLFERIKERVLEGRFVPVGSMWVESDTNLPGSEAMARQFIAGKRFFLDEFGIDTPEVWLPDSFGYSGSIPQIAKAAGARWFLTQKISWNETNRIPHHTFMWEGIDGTRLFTHFPPVDTYNSVISAKELDHAERNYADKGRGSRSLLPYGYGDGGGGPVREMVEAIDRTRSLEGSPKVIFDTPPSFFKAAEDEYPNPEVWAGELYLEFHRGTYTSQLRTKQGNRRSEHLLREAELWASTASIRAGAAYPADELREIWHTVLLQQFHDILPGSSIAWVYQDAEREYQRIEQQLEAIITHSLETLAGPGDMVMQFNAGPQAVRGVASLAAAPATPPQLVAPQETVEGWVLDNGVIRVTLNQQGLVVSALDLATGRESVAPGETAGLFQLHRDTPTQWDAWDIDVHYRANHQDLTAADRVSVIDDALVIERSFSASRMVERVSLEKDSRTLNFDIELDWHETQKILKLAFPIDVHTDRAASEIQFGHIVRPTHTNTSWDAARFETVAHRWVHVSEPDFGVAIVNDSTYGHDVTRAQRKLGRGTVSTVRLSLIRAARFPDPAQDQGEFNVRVGMVVGADVSEAVAAGYQLNLGDRTITGAGDVVEPLISVSHPNVIIEAAKLADDGSGDLIVRLYESLGARVDATITANFETRGIVETDLLEREMASASAAEHDARTMRLSLSPFQLMTLRFQR